MVPHDDTPIDEALLDHLGGDRDLFRLVVERSHDLITVLDAAGRVLYASQSHQPTLGLDPTEVVGMDGLALVHPDDVAGARLGLTASAGEVPEPSRYRVRHANGHWVVVEGVVAVVAERGEPGLIISTARDVTVTVEGERRLRAHHAVVEVLAETTTIEAALPRILAALGEQLDWQAGVFWSPDPRTCTLRCAATWEAAGAASAESVVTAARTASVEPGVGLPGLAWTAQHARWTANVAADDQIVSARRAIPAPTFGAVAFPVVLRHTVLGVLEFVQFDACEPAAELLDLMETIGSEIGQFIERAQAEDELRISEARKGAVIEGALDCVITVDDHGLVTEFNPAAEATFGYSRAEVLGRPMVDLIIPPADRARHQVAFERQLATGESRLLGRRVEMTAIRSGGEEFPIELAIVCVDALGPPQFTAYLRDISARVEAERTRRHLAAIVESSEDAIIGKRLDGTIESWNRGAERLYGYSAEEAIGRPIAMLAPEERRDEIGPILEGVARGERAEIRETVRVHKSGERVIVSLTVSPIQDAQGRVVGASAIARDITDHRRAEAQIAHMAYHDALTGLPNRAMLREHLEPALARAKRGHGCVAVLYVDLDNFKMVNDALGHRAGDDRLKQAAARLRDTVRTTDLVAREGGDEFLVVLADLDPEAPEGRQPGAVNVAAIIAEKILDALHRPFHVVDTDVELSASIGISLYPHDASTGEELLKHADRAMYDAKHAGRAAYRPYVNGHRDALSELSMVAQLRRAIHSGRLGVHYQPLVALDGTPQPGFGSGQRVAAGDIVGVEALVRWAHPSRGILLPDEFIPLAERTGLINAISEHVIHRVCRDVLAWDGRGIHLDVAFNLPLTQLRQPDSVRRILDEIERSSLGPERFMIEITETTAMADPDRTGQSLRDLHDRGVKLAIDDFGTGHSSLSRLAEIPVSALKIDRSFIRGVATDNHAATLVTAIIQLARNLDVEPLAEGIETASQCQFLVASGCRLGQGFYFSPAVPASEIEHLALCSYSDQGSPPKQSC